MTSGMLVASCAVTDGSLVMSSNLISALNNLLALILTQVDLKDYPILASCFL